MPDVASNAFNRNAKQTNDMHSKTFDQSLVDLTTRVDADEKRHKRVACRYLASGLFSEIFWHVSAQLRMLTERVDDTYRASGTKRFENIWSIIDGSADG